ncbi:MAG: SDR family NAD(P)-dependent oxidoreductase [Phycisphaerales bacterium]|nr:SDR family NAD(P)-dependent oxidoreductase [Phycisphaerales bacterium]
MTSVLVTGGAGYIGSHGALALVESGRRVVILDNLFRGHRAAVEAVRRLGGGRVAFVEADIADDAAVLSWAAWVKAALG